MAERLSREAVALALTTAPVVAGEVDVVDVHRMAMVDPMDIGALLSIKEVLHRLLEDLGSESVCRRHLPQRTTTTTSRMTTAEWVIKVSTTISIMIRRHQVMAPLDRIRDTAANTTGEGGPGTIVEEEETIDRCRCRRQGQKEYGLGLLSAQSCKWIFVPCQCRIENGSYTHPSRLMSKRRVGGRMQSTEGGYASESIPP